MANSIPAIDMEESTIQHSLDDIRKLLAERDELALKDPIKAAHIQSEIFRKFAILDWRLSALSGPTRLWRKLKLIPAIDKVRKLAKAGKTDMKRMAIPKLLPKTNIRSGGIPHESGAGDGSSCQRESHLFQNLPPELQETVLSKVNFCAECKLSIVEAIPTAKTLMHWDPTFLKFELVFNILVEQRQLGKDDANNLRKVHPRIRDFINHRFDSWIVSRDDRYSDPTCFPAWLTLEHAATDVNGENPFLAQIVVIYFTPDYFHLYRKVGPALWDCHLDLQTIAWNSILRTNRFLIDCLSLMPNLRRLRLRVGGPEGNISEEEYTEWRRIEEIPLPKLTNLQNLNLLDVHGKGEQLVVQRMLKQYGKGLRTLSVRSSGLMEDTTLCCSRLTRLYIDISHSTEPGNLSKKLEAFSVSPLDLISICNGIGHPGNEEERNIQLSQWLSYGLINFRETLKHLSISGRTFKLKWIPGELTFPKMKILQLSSIRGTSRNWLWLLRFPVLEELYIEKDACDRWHVFRSGNIFKLKWSREAILNSSIWKFLPNLRIISLIHWPSKSVIVTRAECCFNFLTGKSSA